MIFIAGGGLLAYVAAASLAKRGHYVTQLDAYGTDSLQDEPDLIYQIDLMCTEGNIVNLFDELPEYGSDAIIWVCYDTPVTPTGAADLEWITNKVTRLLDANVPSDTIVMISSQVPVGFAGSIQDRYPALRIVSAPENIRRGRALKDWWSCPPVIGSRTALDHQTFLRLYNLSKDIIIWTSLESAEMSKHMINSFVATCIVFANEMNTVAEAVGADYHEVLRGTRRDDRFGGNLPLKPGSADGRHLLRDINYLLDAVPLLPLLSSVKSSSTWNT